MAEQHTALLLRRLAEIGDSLAKSEKALALISFGSVGRELNRLDEYSDLDFFAIVADGAKDSFLDDLSWLTDIAPVAYCFQNTVDGYKLLYADGVFCEFAVFEVAELADIPYAPGRIIWRAEGVDEAMAVPHKPLPAGDDKPLEWILGEALTNLYVGLLRDSRGETLSGMRFIQGHAVDRVLDLAGRVASATAADEDPFGKVRRFEFRYPELANQLPAFMPGYEHNAAAALAILEFLDQHFPVNPAMKQAITALCRDIS